MTTKVEKIECPRRVARWARAIGPALCFLREQYQAETEDVGWFLWSAVLTKILPVDFKIVEATPKPFGVVYEVDSDPGCWWTYISCRKGVLWCTTSLIVDGDPGNGQIEWRYRTRLMEAQ